MSQNGWGVVGGDGIGVALGEKRGAERARDGRETDASARADADAFDGGERVVDGVAGVPEEHVIELGPVVLFDEELRLASGVGVTGRSVGDARCRRRAPEVLRPAERARGCHHDRAVEGLGAIRACRDTESDNAITCI